VLVVLEDPVAPVEVPVVDLLVPLE
jgi:hypothetical protein